MRLALDWLDAAPDHESILPALILAYLKQSADSDENATVPEKHLVNLSTHLDRLLREVQLLSLFSRGFAEMSCESADPAFRPTDKARQVVAEMESNT